MAKKRKNQNEFNGRDLKWRKLEYYQPINLLEYYQSMTFNFKFFLAKVLLLNIKLNCIKQKKEGS